MATTKRLLAMLSLVMFCDETFVNLMLLSCFVSTDILLFSVFPSCGKPNNFLAILPPSERSSFMTLVWNPSVP